MITDAVTETGALGPDEATEAINRLLVENAHLRRKLETSPVIEQAKGILMDRYGIQADTAFDILRRWSQDTNTKLARVAEILTTGGPKRHTRPADVRPPAPPSSPNPSTESNDPARWTSSRERPVAETADEIDASRRTRSALHRGAAGQSVPPTHLSGTEVDRWWCADAPSNPYCSSPHGPDHNVE